MKNDSFVYFDVRNSERFFRQEKSQSWQIKPCFDLQKEDGNCILGKELSYLGRGTNSTVWKYEENDLKYAVKIFFDISYSCALPEGTYEEMKNLSLKNTIKALEILKVAKGNGDILSKYGAYLMTFLEESKDYSLMEMPVSKLLENTNSLESDARLLAQHKIVMHDTKKDNMIFNKMDFMLYLCDIDMFYVSHNEPKNRIDANNHMELQIAFYQILSQYSSTHYHAIYNEFLENLFFKDATHGKAITDKLEYLFSSYDTPKQFFKDNKNYYYKKYL